MLEEYKQLYLESANRIEDWKNYSKNELCNLYIEHENSNLSENYLSAIIYKYWGLIGNFYSISSNVATPEDVYEWLIDSILYALKHRKWKDSSSNIYNDPTGPDKVINRCMKCRRYTYYQALNRKKRKDGVLCYSLDELIEDYKDCNDIFKEEDEPVVIKDFDTDELIREAFKNKQYLTAFMIDEIVHGNTYNIRKSDDGEGEVFSFDKKKLVKRLKELDYKKMLDFAYKYDIDVSIVENQPSYVSKSDKKIKQTIKDVLNKLRLNFQEGKYNVD